MPYKILINDKGKFLEFVKIPEDQIHQCSGTLEDATFLTVKDAIIKISEFKFDNQCLILDENKNVVHFTLV